MLPRQLCHSPASLRSRPVFPRLSLFHTTTALSTAEPPNHYETLGLDPTASPAEIKKRFYTLSRTHHPDHNPDDPQASDRFIKISAAYAVLGSAQKRQHYDRESKRARDHPPPHSPPRGSHSSASTPFGARPASGLSRRRTQFKGPPPSFYRSGGWGVYGRKRQSQAETSGHAGNGESGAGGFGPGQGQAAFGNGVPHFDGEGHHRTQEQQDQRRRRRIEEENFGYAEGGSVFFKFLLITAVVTFAFIPTLFEASRDDRRKEEET